MAIQGLSTALTGLYAAQKAIDTTGNNIANANTEGYTRQRVNNSPIGSNMVSYWSELMPVGTGVTIDNIQRIRDEYLEKNVLASQGKSAFADRSAQTYGSIEGVFNEPSDTAIQSQLAGFWKTWDALAKNPGDAAARRSIVETASTLTSGFQSASAALENQRQGSIEELKANAIEINSLASSIAELNKSVQSARATNGDINNLTDQRDLLVKKLSALADITTNTSETGVVTVSVGGSQLVKGTKAEKLEVDDSGNPVVLRFDDKDGDPTTGRLANLSGGDTGALLESVNSTIPRYQTMLDSAANAVMGAVNAAHTSGKDQYGNPGIAFFTGTTAANMNVNAAIAADPKLIAASSATGGPLDGSNADAIGKLATGTSSPEGRYRELVNVLGIEAQRATRQAEIQKTIATSDVSNATSVSGVNIDEEMTNLIQFQTAYAANAKYLNAINETLDSLLSILR